MIFKMEVDEICPHCKKGTLSLCTILNHYGYQCNVCGFVAQ